MCATKFLQDYKIDKAFFTEQWLAPLCNYTRTYFKPKQEIVNLLNKDITKYKTLGIHCRRSDLVREHSNIAPYITNEEYFNKVMKIYTQYNFEKIYLATEEIEIYNFFMQRIPEILSQYDCYRIPGNYSSVDALSLDVRPLHKYLMGKEILIDILNLSKCDSLLCSISGVSNVVTYFNNMKYKNVFYFDEL